MLIAFLLLTLGGLTAASENGNICIDLIYILVFKFAHDTIYPLIYDIRTINFSGSSLQTDNVDHIELNVNINIHSNNQFDVGNKSTPTGTYDSVF